MGSGPVGVAAHQVEAEYDVEEVQRVEGDDWDMGDEDTQFRGSYACEICTEENEEWDADEEVYAAGKRTSVEMESDNGQEGETQNPRPTKSRRAGPKVGWSNGPLDMSTRSQSSTPKENTPSSGSAAQEKSPARAMPLAPTIKKPLVKNTPAPRGAPLVLKPRGMGEQESWSAAEWFQNAKIEITVAQLMQIAPKARTSIVDALRLQPNPNRKAAQKKRVVIDKTN